ncbi:hypothetical protein PPERSA_07626 [Pseudocohnilembus persalinus]|uniref:Uncharacterized protein n=1 Tax=Pseudocohnilembus persalinus TaxID=266149 RepID=A0A0V0QIC3_PSEPJ|nr:hypothetical protein PPERSA_07626 [Pseudocohnilembus persalinus]|eukprot:KRX01981.1 hypothetical protein PPERSA_07626 [Pseudocohnilembus persalinus]
MRYYSNPFDLAQAVLETKKNNNKSQGDIYQLNQMPTLVKYNLETILQTGTNIQDNTEKLELISEKLKALTMYIAISKLGTQGNIQNQNQILNNISKIVGPNLDNKIQPRIYLDIEINKKNNIIISLI